MTKQSHAQAKIVAAALAKVFVLEKLATVNQRAALAVSTNRDQKALIWQK